MRALFRICLPLLGVLLFFNKSEAASTLKISNETACDILNIYIQPITGQDKKPFFLRLDMDPNTSDEIDNPECRADMRIDTGMEFWLFYKIDLAEAREITFCVQHETCMLLALKNGKTLHLKGARQNLVPEKGSHLVCELGRFRPNMAMKEVCSILAPNLPRDDNGALLTGLGFAGMLWAGRLAPDKNTPVTEDMRLEHLELRKPLTDSALDKILRTLSSQGYIPWQAEFPGLDMDFADMTDQDAAAKNQVLKEAIDRFLNKYGESVQEASIIMAPAKILPALANADAPTSDVQIFTIVLKPASKVLLLDVAAYQGAE